MSSRYPEFQSCCALMTWWTFASRINKIPEQLLFHCPNQSPGGIKYRVNNKRMGVRAGTPDYFLAVPRGKQHGLFLEMKAPDGKPSAEQTETMHILLSQGYAVACCYSTDSARNTIESYLKQP